MKYYTSTTEYNCGIDLHAQQMYVCLMDRQARNWSTATSSAMTSSTSLKSLARTGIASPSAANACSDACADQGITFVLAHALYLHLIHGGKNKNDRIDSETIAHLLRSNLIPPSCVYPAAKRPLRALLRQRIAYVWGRSQLLARIRSHQLAHNRTPVRQTRRVRDFWEEQLLKLENHPLRQIALKIEAPDAMAIGPSGVRL